MPRSWKDLVMEAKKEIKLLQPSEVKAKLDRGQDFILIDVREKDEYDEGHLSRSYLVPRGVLEMTLEKNLRDQNKEIVLYCAGGGRSALAAKALKEMGYLNVASMEGGFEAWRWAGFEVKKEPLG